MVPGHRNARQLGVWTIGTHFGSNGVGMAVGCEIYTRTGRGKWPLIGGVLHTDADQICGRWMAEESTTLLCPSEMLQNVKINPR